MSDGAFTNCSKLETVYCYKGDVPDDPFWYPEGVTIKYLDDVDPNKPDNPDKPDAPVVPEDLGDVNGDGEINMVDVLNLAKYVAEYRDFTFYKDNADMDGNTDINMFDLLALAKKRADYNQ